jgi:hypothetical protein
MTGNDQRYGWSGITVVAIVMFFSVAASAQGVSPCSTGAYGGSSLGFYFDGDDQVYFSSSQYYSSHDYIDAKQTLLSTDNPHDVCTAIARAMSQLDTQYSGSNACPQYKSKGVIDARGVPVGSGFTCGTNPFPASGNNISSAVVLLPAGIITITSPWVLPSNVQLVGMSSCVSCLVNGNTEIQASNSSNGFPTGTAMIYMGDVPGGANNYCSGTQPKCNGISIEHLQLDGASISGLVGIANNFSQELSYVDDVSLTNISGTGIEVLGTPGGNGANNSGPYSNIYFDGTGICMSIYGTNNTRGVSGLNCIVNSSNPGVLIDGSNNTVQNVSITGTTNGPGIWIGSAGPPAQSNLLVNIFGAVTKVVEISTAGSPTNITLAGVSAETMGTWLVVDNVTGSTKITASSTSSTYLALYVLGEAVTANGSLAGYTRFTTNASSSSGTTSGVAWFEGALAPLSTDTCVSGSLYTVSSTITTGKTLYGCIGSAWYALSSN